MSFYILALVKFLYVLVLVESVISLFVIVRGQRSPTDTIDYTALPFDGSGLVLCFTTLHYWASTVSADQGDTNNVVSPPPSAITDIKLVKLTLDDPS